MKWRSQSISSKTKNSPNRTQVMIYRDHDQNPIRRENFSERESQPRKIRAIYISYLVPLVQGRGQKSYQFSWWVSNLRWKLLLHAGFEWNDLNNFSFSTRRKSDSLRQRNRGFSQFIAALEKILITSESDLLHKVKF